jgi:hypothetical protein
VLDFEHEKHVYITFHFKDIKLLPYFAKKSKFQVKFTQIKNRFQNIIHHSILLTQNTMAKTELLYMPPKMGGISSNGFQTNIRYPGQLKKLKSWGPFWSYQLNSTANLVNLTNFLGKWAGFAVLSSW